MKEDVMVVSIDVITDDLMAVEVVPLARPKSKLKLTEIATGGLQGLMKEAQSMKQYRNKIYLTKQFCSDNNIVPFTGLQLEITVPSQEEMQEKYV